MGSRVCCCYLLSAQHVVHVRACGRYSVTLSVRCFRLLSSMCRTSEIDGRCVHLRGSDRCEISYAATLTRSMCRSTFEDPIGVNFIIMLLYSCTRITPRVCTLVLFIIIMYSGARRNGNEERKTNASSLFCIESRLPLSSFISSCGGYAWMCTELV